MLKVNELQYINYVAYLNQVNVKAVYESVSINWSSSGQWLELEHAQQRKFAVGVK